MSENAMNENSASQDTESANKKTDMEEKFPRGLVIRLIVYVAVGHLFAAFVYLLFTLGGQNQ